MTNSRLWLMFLLMHTGCIYESIPILPSVPENVFYLSIAHNSSSNTLVANGVNKIEFTITAYDTDKQSLGNLGFFESKRVKIEVSNGEILSSPYQFSTATPGIYTFKIQNLAPEHNLSRNESLTLNAIEDQPREITTLPVIFHYITNKSLDSIQRADLHKALQNNLKIVNQCYSNQMKSNDPNAANASIQFALAITDPDGKPLEYEGFRIIQSDKESFGSFNNSLISDLIWDGNYWNPKKYINVWIPKLEDNFSWAYFPKLTPSDNQFPSSTYGVVLNRLHINDGTLLAHEFGHMLNLYHVFNESPACEDADQCKDTWSYKRRYDDFETSWQIRKENNCNETFLSNNYMDYWPCYNNTFSKDQVGRMYFTLDNCPFLPTKKNISGRQILIGYSNLSMKLEDDRPYRIN